MEVGMRFNQSQRRITRDETEKKESSPTRIRTAVARFRVSSANHYTIGDTILSLPSFSLVPKRIEIWKYHNSVSKPKNVWRLRVSIPLPLAC